MAFDVFDAPIPGQSLTQEVGSAPYESPPQFVEVDDALEYLFDKLSEKRQATRLVLLLKKGVPVEYIVRTILYDGFTKNKWTPDVALLMGRILMAMVISIGYTAGVKNMKLWNPDKEQDEFLDQFLDDGITEEPDLVEQANTGLPSEFTGLLGAAL